MITKGLHTIDLLIVIVSLIVPFIISIYFSKRQKNVNRFFTAEGTLPAWAIGLSILATLISSVTFLAYPGEGYKSNWILLVQGLMVPVTLLFFAKFFVTLYRKVIKISAYEYFEQRFGFFARLYTSLSFFLTHFSKMGTVIYLLALAFSKIAGLNTVEMIWIIGITVLIVTLLGGIEAIIWLDVIQGFILIAGGLAALIAIVLKVPGGIPTIFKVADDYNKISFAPYDLSFVKLTFWVMVLNGFFYALQKYGTDQTIVQRYLTARSDKEAVKASLIGVLLSVPVWTIFMFIGTALFVYYKVSGNILPGNIRPDEVFPHFMMTEFPPGVIGLILAALMAAAISSLDSDLNCLGAVVVSDFYARFNKNATEKSKLLAGKITIIVAGLASILIALYYVKVGGEGALGIVFTLYSIFSGGLAGLFLLGVIIKRANKIGANIGIISGIVFTAYALLTSTPIEINGRKILLLDLGIYNYNHHKMMLGVYSHLVVFFIGWFASLIIKPSKYEKVEN